MSFNRTDFYNHTLELAGTTKMLGSRINLVWQTIGSFVESGCRQIPLEAAQLFSGLKEADVVCIFLHCHHAGYIEIWAKAVCKECRSDWGYVRLSESDWAREQPCAYCEEGKLDLFEMEFVYLGEPFAWRVLPGMDIDLSRFLPRLK